MNRLNQNKELKEKRADLLRINGIINQIERLSNDFDFANRVTDELFLYQPFLLSMIMGYKPDVTEKELPEVVMLFIIIWEYYKDLPGARARAITFTQFEYFEALNLKFLGSREYDKINSPQILLGKLFERFTKRSPLMDMNKASKTAILLAIKSTIDCFEELTKNESR